VNGADRLGRWVPGLALLRGNRSGDLRRDVVAGVVLAALLVPQAMAYHDARRDG
jgi:MFS superfamily sulfate permease-like transporter